MCRAVLRRKLKIVDFDNVMLIREYQFYCLSFVVLTPVKMSYGLACDCKLSFVLKSVAICLTETLVTAYKATQRHN
jgi:hypothetical protein